MADARTLRRYKMLDSVPIPEAIPELGIEAGTMGVVDSVYDEGRMLLVEVPRPGGTSVGLVDIRVDPGGVTRVVGYSRLGASD